MTITENTEDTGAESTDVAAGRRQFLTKALVAGAAGATGLAVAAQPAGADTGDDLVLGNANTAGAETSLTRTTSGTALQVTGTGQNQAAIIGTGNPDNGFGIRASGLTAIRGDSSAGSGAGVEGNNPNGNAIRAVSVSATALSATSDTGSGLRAASNTFHGMEGVSTTSTGGRFQGGRGGIQLLPQDYTGAPTTLQHFRGDMLVDDQGDLYLCTAEGTPGTFAKLNTPPGDTLFATPERGVGNEAFANQQTRSFDLAAATSLPSTASAVIATVTVVPTGSSGFVSVYDGTVSLPGAPTFATVAWSNRTVVSNTTPFAVTDGTIKVYASTATRVFVDVIGFTG